MLSWIDKRNPGRRGTFTLYRVDLSPRTPGPAKERHYALLHKLCTENAVPGDCVEWIAKEFNITFHKKGCNVQSFHIVRRALEWLEDVGCELVAKDGSKVNLSRLDIGGDVRKLKIRRIHVTPRAKRRLGEMAFEREKESRVTFMSVLPG